MGPKSDLTRHLSAQIGTLCLETTALPQFVERQTAPFERRLKLLENCLHTL